MTRLDVELVTRGLAPSRTVAQRLIGEGRVSVDGSTVRRPATPVEVGDAIEVAPADDYVSRAAGKLAGALDAFATLPCGAPRVAGRRVLDAGASTGGFTQVALRRGAAHVVAVDVGSDQLDPSLREHPRVTVLEHTNVRTIDPALVAPPPELLVADLSFISLTLVLAPLVACLAPVADAVVLVKPQFEVGRERLGSGGVVRSDADRADAAVVVLAAAADAGLRLVAIGPSPVEGTHGNRELVAWLRRDERGVPPEPGAEHRRCADAASAGALLVAEWGAW